MSSTMPGTYQKGPLSAALFAFAIFIFSTVALGQSAPTDKQPAATQIGIGNSLKEQSTRAEGPEAARLLGEAASAYRRALLVLTRESSPEDWATTQHSLGYVLQEQGVRTTGLESIRFIS